MALPKWFKQDDAANRITQALERLVKLYELDLQSRGLFTETGTEEGEVLETSQPLLAKLEAENEYRRAYGLGAGAAIGVLNPLTGQPWGGALTVSSEEEAGSPTEDAYFRSFFAPGTSSGGWSVGPEGAEEAEPGAEEGGSAELGSSGPPSRFSYRPEQKGQGGADSGEESLGSGEQRGGPTSEKAGELPK